MNKINNEFCNMAGAGVQKIMFLRPLLAVRVE